MIGKFQLYRKAIAVLIAGVVPLLAGCAPGVGDYLDPVTTNVLSVGLATAAVISAAPVFDRLSDAAGDINSLALTLRGRK